MAVILNPRARQGFTLLEVMVALAILAITLTSIYRLHAQTMVLSARTRFYTQAPMLAQAKLAEIERQGLQSGEDGSGDFGQDYPGFSWTLHIEDVDGALISEFLKDRQQHLVRIEIAVTQEGEDTYALRTYRYYSE